MNNKMEFINSVINSKFIPVLDFQIYNNIDSNFTNFKISENKILLIEHTNLNKDKIMLNDKMQLQIATEIDKQLSLNSLNNIKQYIVINTTNYYMKFKNNNFMVLIPPKKCRLSYESYSIHDSFDAYVPATIWFYSGLVLNDLFKCKLVSMIPIEIYDLEDKSIRLCNWIYGNVFTNKYCENICWGQYSNTVYMLKEFRKNISKERTYDLGRMCDYLHNAFFRCSFNEDLVEQNEDGEKSNILKFKSLDTYDKALNFTCDLQYSPLSSSSDIYETIQNLIEDDFKIV